MNNRKYGYGFYFRCIQSQLEKAMNEQLKEFDLTKSQLDILRFLKYVKKDHVNQKDIEEFFHISNPTVTGLLNRMEQKGYVVRIHSPDDKRISQEERNLLFKLLAKVKDNLIKEEENHVKDID